MVAHEILVVIFRPVRTKGPYPRICEAFWNGDFDYATMTLRLLIDLVNALSDLSAACINHRIPNG
eukprot:5770392-Karenia_brevis.AAC.1